MAAHIQGDLAVFSAGVGKLGLLSELVRPKLRRKFRLSVIRWAVRDRMASAILVQLALQKRLTV
jgi:hypothetical protein